MPGINSLLDLGRGGLFASQTAIETTGNNIANVNTEGYRRRTVRLEEAISIDYKPGQIGTGVNAAEVVRHFDSFIESSYNDKASKRERWQNLHEQLRGIDSLFNESDGNGLNQAMSDFFTSWDNLAANPDSYPSRESLLSETQNLLSIMGSADQQMDLLQEQAGKYIQQDVTEANEIIANIAQINKQINEREVPGQNNPNELYDRRDKLVRQLAEKMDIKTIDNGGGDYTVLTHAGHALVDGQETYSLKYEASKSFEMLSPGSDFDGEINFSGSDEFEYTFEVVKSGDVSSGSSAAQMRVSLDGGQTFLKDESGDDLLISARPESDRVTVRGLDIWFGQQGDPQSAPTTTMQAGDKFQVVPKEGLYWYRDTSSAENITPQLRFNGTENERRLTGGSLTGYFNFRDDYIGRYRDKLDTLAETLVWETNRLHSQGAGLEHFEAATGTYSVNSNTTALGSDSSGLDYRSRLSSGSAMMHVYDKTTGNIASSASLNFSGNGAFDPSTHSLEDVRDAINNTFSGSLSASIVNHELKIEAEDGYEFEFGQDTTGLYAALGLNSFFQGSSARDMSMNPNAVENMAHINSGHVNGAGEANPGDNTTAQGIAGLSTSKVTISTLHAGTVNESMGSFYNSLVAEVGADTDNAEFNFTYQKALSDDLDQRQQEVSGVNLDQEMSELIKFQHSYTAAAKLITTADQMLQTLLGLKQ
ncbi:flagellar hook-associated protein FlgK [Desulfohalovibrio reitneri]|uniref:flagellar hook-associated protein FlgK n=1 Tax=Desulfohalovibrio reitneri TaxID=1307759 RepID=UPI0004A73166|nr:flagellar hook-associated protein FlgK [Desulfohalovibrio reitneri]